MPSPSTLALLTVAAAAGPVLSAPLVPKIGIPNQVGSNHPHFGPGPVAGKFFERSVLTEGLEKLIGAGEQSIESVIKDAVIGGSVAGATSHALTPSQQQARALELGSIGKGIAGLVAGLGASTVAGSAIDEIKSLFRRSKFSDCARFINAQPTLLGGSPILNCLQEHDAAEQAAAAAKRDNEAAFDNPTVTTPPPATVSTFQGPTGTGPEGPFVSVFEGAASGTQPGGPFTSSFPGRGLQSSAQDGVRPLNGKKGPNRGGKKHAVVQQQAKRLSSGPDFLEAIKEKFQNLFGRDLSEDDAAVLESLFARDDDLAKRLLAGPDFLTAIKEKFADFFGRDLHHGKRLSSGPDFLEAIKEKFQDLFGRDLDLSEDDAAFLDTLLSRSLEVENLD